MRQGSVFGPKAKFGVRNEPFGLSLSKPLACGAKAPFDTSGRSETRASAWPFDKLRANGGWKPTVTNVPFGPSADVLREAQKNPAEMARDPFAALRPPTQWLKEKTFDFVVVALGKGLMEPLTNGTQWLINGLRTKASDAMRGNSGEPSTPATPTAPTKPVAPTPPKSP